MPTYYVDDSIEAMVKLVRKYTEKITLNKCGERAIMMFSEQELRKDNTNFEIYSLLKESEVSKEMRNEGQ